MQAYSITDRAKRNHRNFRLLMQAMSRPGRIFQLEARSFQYEYPALAVAECLLDHEVSFSVAGEGAGDDFHKAIATATGARPAIVPEADFLFIVGATSQGTVRLAKRGTAAFPDQGATLIYCLDAGRGPDGERLRVRLCGPGIEEIDGIAPEMPGLAPAELRELSSVNGDFPLGVDTIFLGTRGEVMGLPRSTRIALG